MSWHKNCPRCLGTQQLPPLAQSDGQGVATLIAATETFDGQKQAFEIALDWIAQKKVQVGNMLTHPFPTEN